MLILIMREGSLLSDQFMDGYETEPEDEWYTRQHPRGGRELSGELRRSSIELKQNKNVEIL